MVFHAVLQSARLVVMPSIVKIIDRNVTETFLVPMTLRLLVFVKFKRLAFPSLVLSFIGLGFYMSIQVVLLKFNILE